MADATLAYVVESVAPEAAIPSAATLSCERTQHVPSESHFAPASVKIVVSLSAFASRPSWLASSAHWRAQQITDVPAPQLAEEIAEEQAAPTLAATFAAAYLMQEIAEAVQPTPQETAQNHTMNFA